MSYTFWIPTVISIGALIWNYGQSRQIIKIQTKADAKRLIHKFQFEKEFAIYNELWTLLINLRNAAASLRPVMDFIEAGKTNDEVKKERLDTWNSSFNAVAKSFDYNKPFYSLEIYKEIENVLKVSRNEAIDYSLLEQRREDYWNKVKKI